MLSKYAQAIKIMKQLPDDDPHSWNWWWYTHWIKGPPAFMWEESRKHKTQVIASLPPDVQSFAEATWNGCQAHPFNPDDPEQYQQWYFLPWHRLYLYQFEQTIREVLDDDDFSLPYWNPVTGNEADLSLPLVFRDPESPLFNGTRWPWVNGGERIDMLWMNWLSLDCPQREVLYRLADRQPWVLPPDSTKTLTSSLISPSVAIWPTSPRSAATRSSICITAIWTGCGKAGTGSAIAIQPIPSISIASSRSRTGMASAWTCQSATGTEPRSSAMNMTAMSSRRTPGSAAVAQTSAANRGNDPKTEQALQAAVSSLPDARLLANVANSVPSQAPDWSLTDGSGKTVSLSQYKGRPVVVIFYRGYGCLLCMKQLNDFAEKAREFADAGIDVVAISTNLPDDLRDQVRAYEKKGGFPFQLVSNAKLDVFEAYGCLDSNRKPLHGTFLIDAQGRIRWQNIGVKPFEDPTFVLNEAKKLFSLASVRSASFDRCAAKHPGRHDWAERCQSAKETMTVKLNRSKTGSAASVRRRMPPATLDTPGDRSDTNTHLDGGYMSNLAKSESVGVFSRFRRSSHEHE